MTVMRVMHHRQRYLTILFDTMPIVVGALAGGGLALVLAWALWRGA